MFIKAKKNVYVKQSLSNQGGQPLERTEGFVNLVDIKEQIAGLKSNGYVSFKSPTWLAAFADCI
jgi:hypothetical protein